MSTGSEPPHAPLEADRELAGAQDAVRGLAAGRFEVLGPLGRTSDGEHAFLGRPLAGGRLVVLRRRLVGSPSGFNSAVLEVIERLDDSVPPPAGSCTFCHAPFSSWEPACPECGADLAGSSLIATTDDERARMLAAVRAAAPAFEVFGDIPRASGGASVFFAREAGSGHLVALHLEGWEEGGATPERPMTVAATRMMRPRRTYAAVGGAVRSPSIPMPAGAAGRSTSGLGTGGVAGGPSRKICPQCGEVFETEARFCPRDGVALRSQEKTDDLVGQVIADRYHIIRVLGEGGMGKVYLGEHVRMGRNCAVKVMNSKLLHDADSVSRFCREAANASRITHPNVAAIYDFGEAEDIVYIAMEYVDGPSLLDLLAKEGRQREQRVIAIAIQIADALIAAHDYGIVHRDLKPDNVMLTRSRSGQDTVKVVDFGIAKATQGGGQTVTRTGFVIGTPAYMSPEQILGEALDGRSDIYSLGCIMYELLTGERVFAGTSGEVSIHQRLTQPAPRPRLLQRDISPDLDEVVGRALARSTDQRFQSAAALRDALAAVVLQPSYAATEEPRATTVLRHRSQRSGGPRLGKAVAASLTLFTIGVAAWHFWPRPEEQTPVPPIPATLPSQDGARPDTGPMPVAAPPSAPEESATIQAPSTPAPAPPESSSAEDGAVAFDADLPAGALVTVDGKAVELAANGTIPLPPGRHRITIRASGFRPFSRTIQVGPGGTATISPELARDDPAPAPAAEPPPAPSETEAAPASTAPGTIVIRGDLPEGAALDVDGRPLAIGVRSATAAPGPHWVRLMVPGYRSDSSLVQVVAGQETEWTAPRLVAVVRPVPQPPVSQPQPAGDNARPAPVSKPVSPPPEAGPTEAQIRGEIVTLLADYQGAINARDLDRLKVLYPGMPAESERRWKDLFGKDVNDLKAAVTLTSIVPASEAQVATFRVVLTFKPRGGKAQKYQLTNVATVRREGTGWRILDLLESGS